MDPAGRAAVAPPMFTVAGTLMTCGSGDAVGH